MEYEAERATVGRFTVRVVNDPDGSGSNPREWCNLGTFYTGHTRYSSPDEYGRGLSVVEAVSAALNIRPAPQRDRNGRFIQFDVFEDDAAEMMRKARAAGHVVIPVWLYDHSGRVYQAAESNPFSCRWDSGCVGFVFVSAENIRREYGRRITAKVRETVAKVLKAEVETWSHWAAGDVWGFVVEDPDGDEVDSCWGFVGGDDEIAYCLAQGVESARAHA